MGLPGRRCIAGFLLTSAAVPISGCVGARSNLATHNPYEVRVATKAPRAAEPGESASAGQIAQAPPLDRPAFEDARAIRLTAGSEESPPPPAPVSAEGARPVLNEAVSGWTLASLEEFALQYNPSIRQASSSAHKAMGFHDQVGKKPNPTVGYNATQLADRGTDQHTAFVEQQIVLGDKLSRNQTVLNQEIQSQLWEVETQRYRVLTDVRQRYYEALAAQRRLELTREFHTIAAQGVTIAQARLNAKEGTTPELLQAEILLNQIDVQRRQAEAAFRGTWKQLMAVVGTPGTPPSLLQGSLPDHTTLESPDSIRQQALAASPELQAARARVSRAKANIERQQVQAIPNLTFMVGGGVDYGTNSGMMNAQLGLPLPIYNRNEGNIAAAHAELSRACEDVRRIELSIESRIAGAGQDFEAAAAAVQQYHEVILPKARQTLDITEGAYAAGEFEFLQVLIVRKTYFDANLEYVQSQANLATAEAFLMGMGLTGGLDSTRDTDLDSGLRDQSLTGE